MSQVSTSQLVGETLDLLSSDDVEYILSLPEFGGNPIPTKRTIDQLEERNILSYLAFCESLKEEEPPEPRIEEVYIGQDTTANVMRKPSTITLKPQKKNSDTAENATATNPNASSKNSTERNPYERFREKEFVCDFCDVWFTLKHNVQTHIFNYHMGSGLKTRNANRGKRYKCTKCEKMFKSREKAERHHQRDHVEKIKTAQLHRCTECTRVYQTASQLREHFSIQHLNERPYACDRCDARFGRRGGLRRHVQMVHTDHTYKCPVEGCDHPGYKCSKALAAHIRSVHTKDRPFICAICDKGFVRKNDLKMHELTHTKSSDIECEYCGQAFKRLHYLQKHLLKCQPKYVNNDSSSSYPTDEVDSKTLAKAPMSPHSIASNSSGLMPPLRPVKREFTESDDEVFEGKRFRIKNEPLEEDSRSSNEFIPNALF